MSTSANTLEPAGSPLFQSGTLNMRARDVGAPTRRLTTIPFGRSIQWLIVLFGLLLQFNPQATQWDLPLNRLSDGVALLLMLFTVPIGLTYFTTRTLTFLLGLGLLLGAAILLKSQSGEGDLYPVLVFFAYASTAFWLVRLVAANEQLLEHFALATLIGFVLAAMIQFLEPFIPLDGTGLVPTRIVLDSNDWIFQTIQDKPGGIWAQGNESGHVYAIAGSAAFYLAMRSRVLKTYLVYFALLVATFFLTLNRGGLVAPTVLLIIGIASAWRFRDRLSLLLATLILLPVGIAFTSTLDMSGGVTIVEQRTASDTNLSNNVAERVLSTSAGVSVALEHPFGLGNLAKRLVMRNRVGIAATHNAILSAAFDVGVGIVLLFMVGLVRSFTASGPGATFFRTNAFLCLVSGSFEDLFRNPAYMFAFAIIVVIGLTGNAGFHRRRRRRHPMPTRFREMRQVAFMNESTQAQLAPHRGHMRRSFAATDVARAVRL